MNKVQFTIGDTVIEAELRDTPTAKKLLEHLPVEATGSYWGGEFYFTVPFDAAPEPDAVDVVDPGTLAFWTAGSCLCLFWGPTPVSQGVECRAASEVNIVGEVINKDGLERLSGNSVKVEAE